MSANESNKFTQDSDITNGNSYFSSPELSQRADLLRHLTENSDLIPLIRGAKGMGKSTFIQNLLDLAPENWIPARIKADVMLQPDTLLVYLAELFDLDVRSERLIDDLTAHFADMRHDGFLPVIVVDDAHLLPEATVIALLRLHERSANELPLAQILLFAEPEIDELLKTPQLRVMNLQSLQLLDMPKFTLEQTSLYLEHLLSSEESSSLQSLTATKIEQIHSETEGTPGLIKEHARALIASEKREVIAERSANAFSGMAVLGGGVAVVLALLVLIFQDDINTLFSGESETIDIMSNDLVETDTFKPIAIPEFDEDVGTEPVDAALPSDMEIVEGEDEDLGSVAEADVTNDINEPTVEDEKLKEQALQPEVSQEQTKQAPAAPKIAEETAPANSKETPAVETKTPPEKKSTAKPVPEKKETAENAVSPAKQTAVTAKTKEQFKQKQQKSSTAVATDSPAKSEKSEIVQKKSEPIKQETKVTSLKVEKSAPAKPQISAAPVEERSTNLPKEEAEAVKLIAKTTDQAIEQPIASAASQTALKTTSGILGEQWLLAQKPSSYTIQLVGLQDETGVAKFVQRHSLSGPVAYYRTKRAGKSWFPVLYGVYSTKSRAITARNNLPESIINSGPWLRTLSAVQKDIRAR